MSLTRLVHYIGRNRTLDMLILGEDLSAEKAFELGLVTRVVPEAEFDVEIAKVAARVASGAPISFRSIKETVRETAHLPIQEAFDLVTRRRLRTVDVLYSSDDQLEGARAFAEKRAPVWKGR